MSNPTKLGMSSEDGEKTPNYTLRRAAAVGAATIALLGVWKAGELAVAGGSALYTELTETDYDDHNCVNNGETVVIGQNESVWNEAAEPLAEELNIPVDKAMGILTVANPDIDSLGKVQPGTSIQIPDCEP